LDDAAGSSFSLICGTSADRVHISASLREALSGKGCFQHGGSVVAVQKEEFFLLPIFIRYYPYLKLFKIKGRDMSDTYLLCCVLN
jgi:hypothetical protein